MSLLWRCYFKSVYLCSLNEMSFVECLLLFVDRICRQWELNARWLINIRKSGALDQE